MELAIIIGGAIIANYILGVVKSIGADFSFVKMRDGFIDTLKKIIGTGFVFLAFVYVKDVEVLGALFTPVAWTVLGFIGMYHGNSVLINATKLSGIPHVAILEDLDIYIKDLIGKSNPNLVPQGSKVDLTLEAAHLLKEEE